MIQVLGLVLLLSYWYYQLLKKKVKRFFNNRHVNFLTKQPLQPRNWREEKIYDCPSDRVVNLVADDGRRQSKEQKIKIILHSVLDILCGAKKCFAVVVPENVGLMNFGGINSVPFSDFLIPAKAIVNFLKL